MIEETKPPTTTITRKVVGEETPDHPRTLADIAIVAFIGVMSVPLMLVIGHALPLIDCFFQGLKPLVGILGFCSGIALIAMSIALIPVIALSIWYMYHRFSVDIKRRAIEARKFKVDPSGNYDAFFDTTKTFAVPKPSATIQPVPQHFDFSPQYHFINRTGTKKDDEVAELPLLGQGNAQKPSVEELASKVERNSLQINLGRSIKTGQDLIVNIAASHIKIIGTSQFGKSCEAAAILAQIEQTHDPDRLQIVPLDMENKVVSLFEKSSHVAHLDIGRGHTARMYAKNEEDIPIYLHYIAQELERRSKLDLSEVEQLPHILVYFEEFLYVKKAIKLDGGKTCAQFLLDFDAIATRGLKLGIHLMACTQTDYADEDLKDAKAQFKTRLAFSVPPSVASSAGFLQSDLVKQNFINGIQGQFVIETPGLADIGIAPDYDVKSKLKALHETQVLSPRKTMVLSPESWSQEDSNQIGNQDETTPEAMIAELEGEQWIIENTAWKLAQLIDLLHETQDVQYSKIWKVFPGSGREFKKARAERVALVKHAQSLLNSKKGHKENEISLHQQRKSQSH